MPNEFQVDFEADGNVTKITILKRNHFVGIYGHYNCGHELFVDRTMPVYTKMAEQLCIQAIRRTCPICKKGALKSLTVPPMAWEEIPNWEWLADAILDGKIEITIHEPAKEGA